MSFDREAGVGEIAPLQPAVAGADGGGRGGAAPSPPSSYPVAARDILSCGHRWLAPGEGVEFRVHAGDGRAVEILRSFEPAAEVGREGEGMMVG